jgi:hypothetical protein
MVMKYFNHFLDNLLTETNSNLIESVREAYNILYEGYMDVRPDPDSIESMDALTRFNINAVKTCEQMGSPVLSRLHDMNMKNQLKYAIVDEEPDVNNSQTNDFMADYVKKFVPISKDGTIGVYGKPKGGF